MNYKVLYRKYRPASFDDVVGQNNTITLLKDSIINDKISHAYIFSGPRGTGKTSCAKIFAKAINCLDPVNGNPCGKCENCINFATSNDIYEIDAASNNGVDQIREIVESIKLTPISLKYKVYIIDEVHMLSTSAFNALLLTLEEPPKHAVFILATTDIEDVPITVLSRCQRLDFRKITNNDIESNLKKICTIEKIAIEDAAIEEIASYADGGMRDALSILDQLSKSNEKITQDNVLNTIGVISDKKIKELIEYYKENNALEISKFVDNLRETSIDFKSFIKKVIRCLRNEALHVLNDSKDYALYDKYKELCFNLSSLLCKLNVNVDVYTLFEFTFIPTVEKKENTIVSTYKVDEKANKSEQNFEEKMVNEQETAEFLSDAGLKPEKKAEFSTFSPKSQFAHTNCINVRVNNCFVGANKQFLNKIKDFWLNFINKLSNKKLKGMLMDVDVVLASDNYAVLLSNFDDNMVEINNNIAQIEEKFNSFSNTEYKLVAVNPKIWEEKTEEYKNNIKNNKKYIIIEETDDIFNDNIVSDVFVNSKIEVK